MRRGHLQVVLTCSTVGCTVADPPEQVDGRGARKEESSVLRTQPTHHCACSD